MESKEFFDLMKRRQSCRSFDYSRPVPNELVISIMEAALLSPSACNSQPYHIFAVQGEQAKTVAEAKAVSFNSFIEECNTFFIITESNYSLPAKIGSVIKKVDFKAIDIGILTANLVNAACACGIETCILGMFDEKKLQQLIASKQRIRLVIAAGYPKAGYELRDKKRKPFAEKVHFI
ncbi:MAG: nitroreductase family protein [Treponema sp.]